MPVQLSFYFQATFLIFCVQILGSFGAPEQWGAGFSVGGKGKTDLVASAAVKAGNGKISGDVSGSAAADLESNVRAGAHYESNGQIIGVNGGLNGKIGGAVQGGVHGDAGLNNDGSISAGANSSLSTTSHAGISGHANLATGDEERRQLAIYEGNSLQIYTGNGTKTDLLPLISIAAHIINNFWLYFWLGLGFIIFLICCCLFTVCGAYLKLVSDVQSLKTAKAETEIYEKKASLDTKVQMKDWETEYQ